MGRTRPEEKGEISGRIARPRTDESSGPARLHGRQPAAAATIREPATATSPGSSRQDDRTEGSRPMGSLVLYMSMSLDGFIAGPGDSRGNPFGTKGHWLGDGGEDLHRAGMPAGARAGRAGDPAGPGPVRPGATVLRHSRARPHRTRAGPGARVAQRSAPSLRGAVRVNPPIRP